VLANHARETLAKNREKQTNKNTKMTDAPWHLAAHFAAATRLSLSLQTEENVWIHKKMGKTLREIIELQSNLNRIQDMVREPSAERKAHLGISEDAAARIAVHFCESIIAKLNKCFLQQKNQSLEERAAFHARRENALREADDLYSLLIQWANETNKS
jgi:hypothetical protein